MAEKNVTKLMPETGRMYANRVPEVVSVMGAIAMGVLTFTSLVHY